MTRISILGCAFFAFTATVTMINLAESNQRCEYDLESERLLKEQALAIEYNLIAQAADDWCSDSTEQAYQKLYNCEHRVGIDDNVAIDRVMSLWAEYKGARVKWCDDLFEKDLTPHAWSGCMGPAVSDPKILEVISIHIESKKIEQGI